MKTSSDAGFLFFLFSGKSLHDERYEIEYDGDLDSPSGMRISSIQGAEIILENHFFKYIIKDE